MSTSTRLWSVLGANLVLVGGLVVVGITAHSIAVYAEGADYLADAAAIGVSLLAISLSRRPPTPRRPQGYPRATHYAALVNVGWLLALSILIAAGAADRLATGVHEVHGLPVLIASGIAALVMLGGALLLGEVDPAEPRSPDPAEPRSPDPAEPRSSRDSDKEDLNVRAVLLDTTADAAAAAGVAVSGAIIYASGTVFWLDPAVALIISTVVSYHALRLLRRIRSALRS